MNMIAIIRILHWRGKVAKLHSAFWLLVSSVFPLQALADTTPAFLNAKIWSAADLNEACKEIGFGSPLKPDDMLQVGVCLGEIEALNFTAQGLGNERLRACIPPGITRLEKLRVVVVYIDQNHDRLREPFEVLALEALAHSWPCPTG
jgi:Rap1a immunity proteins